MRSGLDNVIFLSERGKGGVLITVDYRNLYVSKFIAKTSTILASQVEHQEVYKAMMNAYYSTEALDLGVVHN